MKILIYIEPLIEKGRPNWKSGWVSSYASDLINSFDAEIECLSVIPSSLEREAEPLRCKKIVVAHDDLPETNRLSSTEILTTFHNEKDQGLINKYAQYYIHKLATFTPDLIISFTPAPFLKSLFPQARLLHHELGYFSRSPYPRTMFFDPMGMYHQSFIHKNFKWIENLPISEYELSRVERIKNYIYSQWNAHSPFQTIISSLRDVYSSLVLIPLQDSDHYSFDQYTTFKNQFEYLNSILQSSPKTIGYIVTEHPDYPSLNRSAISYLQKRFPNFIYLESANDYYASSQMILPFVDGVISISSTIALQTLLFDKIYFGLSGYPYGFISSDTTIQERRTMELSPSERLRNKKLFYFFLTAYVIPAEHLKNGKILKSYFELWNTSHDEKTVFSNLLKSSQNLSFFEDFERCYEFGKISKRKNIYFQIYWDIGEGFSEQLSCVHTLPSLTNGTYKNSFHPPHSTRSFRVDFTNMGPVLISNVQISIDGQYFDGGKIGNVLHFDSDYLFLDQDPHLKGSLPDNTQKIEVSFDYDLQLDRITTKIEEFTNYKQKELLDQKAIADMYMSRYSKYKYVDSALCRAKDILFKIFKKK